MTSVWQRVPLQGLMKFNEEDGLCFICEDGEIKRIEYEGEMK